MKRMILCAACLLALLPAAAVAGEGGWYLGLQGGASIPETAENDSDTGTFNFEFKPGPYAAAVLGYDLRENFPSIGTGRLELEVAWRRNRLDEAEWRNASGGAEGDLTAYSAMLNTFGEYRGALPWIPYLGVGAGVAKVSLEDVRQFGQAVVDDEDTVFAWQAGGGIGLMLGRRAVLDLGYRYFSAIDPEFSDAQGESFTSEFVSHTVLLGLRLDF